MPSQSLPPAEEHPTIHCATHEKPFPCPDCVAARSPSQSLPDGVTRLAVDHVCALHHHPDGALMYVSDRRKIEEQVRQQMRERVLDELEADGWEVRGTNQLSKALARAFDHKGDTGG